MRSGAVLLPALLAAGLLAAACRPAPGESSMRVTVIARAPLDCIRVVASDQHRGPPVAVEFAAPVGPATERSFVIAIYRHPEWGRYARLYAEGFKGGCDGTLVTQSVPQVVAFGADKGDVPAVSLTLDGVDLDGDGYVWLLPDGTVFDCQDDDPHANPGAQEPCDSPVDRDCDGRAGCDRPQCLGQRDWAGRRCCPAGPSSGVELQCGDGLDDDCDGLTDCADPDCLGKPCDAHSRVCSAAGACACAGTSSVETACGDGLDDDCDGLVDCADPDCFDEPCPGGRCAGATCCPATSGAELCADGLDNDCNGLTDCADPACAGKPAGAGQRCCAATGAAVPATEANCADGADDDCDGLADCADLDCNQQACALGGGEAGVCFAFQCRGEVCTNAVDDNGDGKADCADPLCAGMACNPHGRTCVAGACTCPFVAVEGAAAGQCADAQDNDCDGLVDCADPSCAGQPCAAGRTCQQQACVCALSEPSEVSCADGADNDCDGLADCADSDCAGKACSATGGVCQAGQCTCAQGPEQSCQNGADDDCDGLVDCADPDCASLSCGPFAKVCQAGACACPTGTQELCANGLDDDCDGLVDCQDVAGCPQNAVCSATGGRQCTGGACVCRAGQSPEVACNDGVDNDCDGLADCADPDCQAALCGPFGQKCLGAPAQCSCPAQAELCGDGQDNDCDGLVDCQDTQGCPQGTACGANGRACSATGTCACPGGAGPEVSCGNGADDDCDGLADCADPDCAGAPCTASGQSFCCGTTCAATATQGQCGYCSLTCAATFACAAPGTQGPISCACAVHGDCPASTRCHGFPNGQKACVECEVNGDCPPGRPVCNASSFTCHCPPGTSCTPACTSDGDCGGTTPRCDVFLTRCVGCLADGHCAPGQVCRNLACAAP